MNPRGRKRIYHIAVGQPYGKHTVLAPAGRDATGKNEMWLCMCACGSPVTLSTSNLIHGQEAGCNKCKNYVVPASALKRMYRTYKVGALSRGLCFELSFDHFAVLAKQICHYCSAEPAVNSYSENSKIRPALNGIDRVNPAFGYTLNNTVPCCKFCNNGKWTMMPEQFIAWARRVVCVANMRRIVGD